MIIHFLMLTLFTPPLQDEDPNAVQQHVSALWGWLPCVHCSAAEQRTHLRGHQERCRDGKHRRRSHLLPPAWVIMSERMDRDNKREYNNTHTLIRVTNIFLNLFLMPRLSRFAYKPSYQRSPCSIFIHNPVSLHSSPLFLSEPLLTKPSNTAGLTIAFPFSCKHLSIANHSFRSSPQIYPACTIFLSLVPQIPSLWSANPKY